MNTCMLNERPLRVGAFRDQLDISDLELQMMISSGLIEKIGVKYFGVMNESIRDTSVYVGSTRGGESRRRPYVYKPHFKGDLYRLVNK